MTTPNVNARSSVEINDSCNDCCPRFCCFGRKVKRHHKDIARTSGQSDLTVIVQKADKALASALQPAPPAHPVSVRYGDMPPVNMTDSGIDRALGNPEGSK